MKSGYQMLKNFVKEAKEFAKNGAPHVKAKEYQKRIDACMSCPHLKKEIERCGLCGCLVEHKAKWATSSCPDDPKRWDKAVIGVDGTEVKVNQKNERKNTPPKTSNEVQPTNTED